MKKIKLKAFNYKKGLKKIQGRGIYNKKIKIIGIISIIVLAILTISIYKSRAMYMYDSGKRTAYNTQASKKIKVHAKGNGGYVGGSLADKILENNTLKMEIPNYSLAEPTATGDSSKSGLYSTQDNEGTSYYFRGKVDNYVEFAGKTWRIIRINGDGSIRIVLDEVNLKESFNNYKTIDRKYAGYTYGNGDSTPCTKSNPCISTFNGTNFNNNRGTDSTVKEKLEQWYIDNLKNYDNLIAETTYCNDTSYESGSTSGVIYYGGYKRLLDHTPTLVCPDTSYNYGGYYKLKIGLVTADEINMGGLVFSSNEIESTTDNYFSAPYYVNFSMSPSSSDTNGIKIIYSHMQGIGWYGSFNTDAKESQVIRPVINIRADAIVESGNGQSGSNAYKINLNERTTDYKTSTTMKVYPNPGYEYDTTKGVTCTNGQSGSYNKTTNTLTINSPSKDTECTVNFKPIKLVDKIIADAKSKNIYKEGQNPDFIMGEPPNSGSSATGSGLFTAQDDKGTSYYFRGDYHQINNYVHFAGLNWRILRINGDNTIRLILDDNIGDYVYNDVDDNDKYVGYTYDNTPCTNSSPCQSTYNKSSNTFSNTHNGTNSTIKEELEDWYKSNLKNYDDKIAYGTFCNDTSYFSIGEHDEMLFDGYKRLYYKYGVTSFESHPTLECPNPTDQNGALQTYGGVYKLKIGLISADETNFAGLVDYGLSFSRQATNINYIYRDHYSWSITPLNGWASVGHSGCYGIAFGGYSNQSLSGTGYVSPVINLASDILFTTGDGSSSSPYEV